MRIRFRLRRNAVKKNRHTQQGMTIVEYAVAAGLIVAAVAGSFALLGASVGAIVNVVVGFL